MKNHTSLPSFAVYLANDKVSFLTGEPQLVARDSSTMHCRETHWRENQFLIRICQNAEAPQYWVFAKS